MATIDWPSTLPQEFQKPSFNNSPNSGIIRTEMDTGYPKIRLRFTATTENYSGTMILTETQKQAFLTFFRTTIRYGSLRFNFPDPYGGADIEARWVISTNGEPYSLTQDGDTTDWRLSFTLEELP